MISIAQHVEEELKKELNAANIANTINYIKEVTEKHVDVFITYTLYELCNEREKINSDIVLDRIRAATSIFQKSAVLCDTYTFRKIYPHIEDVVVRGSIVVVVLDYDDIRNVLHRRSIIQDIDIIENYEKALIDSLHISEALEKSIIIRIPIFLSSGFKRNLYKTHNEIEEIPPRNIGLFFRDWKVKYAWVSADLKIHSQDSTSILSKVIKIETFGEGEKQVLVDLPLKRYLESILAQDKDFARNYKVIFPRIYNLEIIENIANNSTFILTTYDELGRKCVEKYVLKRDEFLKKYIDYIRESLDPEIRLLLSVPLALLNLYRDIDMLVVSSFKVPVVDDQGRYDTRIITRIPSDIYDTVDLVLGNIDSLSILEKKLPPNISIMLLTRELDLNSIRRIRDLKRTIVVTFYSDHIVNMLRTFKVKHVILNIRPDSINSLRGIVGKPCVVLLYYVKNVPSVNSQLCDMCGMCSKLMCDSIRIEKNIVKIDYSRCRQCLSCILICTRGVFFLPDQED